MTGDFKLYSAKTLAELTREARRSPRLRKNLNVHPVLEDAIQRLFHAMEPDTYVRPHRHARPTGWELMVAVRGAFSVLRFNAAGTVQDRADLRAGDGDCAVEIPAYAWHSVVSLEPGTVMFEVKPGPYSPLEDKEFAAWAPSEGDSLTPAWTHWFAVARPGERAEFGARP
jgi:cupin fold WbuC family metalloprotein